VATMAAAMWRRMDFILSVLVRWQVLS